MRPLFLALAACLALWLLPPTAHAQTPPSVTVYYVCKLLPPGPGVFATTDRDVAEQWIRDFDGYYVERMDSPCQPRPSSTPTSAPPSATPTSSATPTGTSTPNGPVRTPTSGTASTSTPTRPPTSTTPSASPTAPSGNYGPWSSTTGGGGGNSPGADTSPPVTVCEMLPGGPRMVTIHRNELPDYQKRACPTPMPTATTGTLTATAAMPPTSTATRTPTILETPAAIPTATPSSPGVPEPPEVVSDAPLCARWTPDGVVEGPEACQPTSGATPVPTRVAGVTERPVLLPRTGAGRATKTDPALLAFMGLLGVLGVAGAVVAVVSVLTERRR